MSIRWIRNVVIGVDRTTLEIQLGYHQMGDKCYTRIGSETEMYFENICENREDIIAQGIDMLRQRLDGQKITYPNGSPYDWQ